MPSGEDGLDCELVITLPPYALAPVTFRFRALVALAERLPIGGEREVVLATFVTARLLWDWSGEDAFPLAATQARALGSRQWLQSVPMNPGVRGVFQQVIDSVIANDRDAVAAAWERALTQTSRAVEGAARSDFKALSARLRGELPLAQAPASETSHA